MKLTPRLTTALLLATGFLVRAVSLGSASIWFDEAWSYYMARLPFEKYLPLAMADFSPPLNELVLRPFVALSTSLWMLRLPALLASAAALYMAWLFIDRYIDSHPLKLFAAGLVAFLPSLLWTAQDARCYMLYAALYLIAVWCAAEARWWALGAVCALLLWTHATAAAFVAGALLLGFLVHPRDWQKVLLVGCLALLSVWPLVSWIVNLGNVADKHWLAALDITWLFSQTVEAFFVGTLPLGAALWFVVLLTATSITAAVSRSRNAILFGVAFAVPFVILLGVSLVRNVILYRALIPLIIPFVLWMTAAVDGFRHRWGQVALASLWTLFLLTGLQAWHPADRGGHLAEAAAQIRADWQAGDVLYYATGTVALPFDYYLHDLPHYAMDNVDGLMSTGGTTGAVMERIPLEQVPHVRAWVIYPLDPLFKPLLRWRVRGYTGRYENCTRLEQPVQIAQMVVCLAE